MSDSANIPPAGDPSHAEHASLVHIVPVPVLLTVFAALLVLTFATVAATWVDLGNWNLWIAIGIATLKATLVALYFMHLRYDHPFHALVFVTAFLFLGLLLSLTLLDTYQYQPEVNSFTQSVR